MSPVRRAGVPASLALTLALGLSACGGGQAATPETVPPIPASPPQVDPTPLHHGTAAAAPAPATAASVAHGASIQFAAHEVEEEIERKAAMGFLGGPVTWALLVLLALIVVYVIATQ